MFLAILKHKFHWIGYLILSKRWFNYILTMYHSYLYVSYFFPLYTVNIYIRFNSIDRVWRSLQAITQSQTSLLVLSFPQYIIKRLILWGENFSFVHALSEVVERWLIKTLLVNYLICKRTRMLPEEKSQVTSNQNN